MRVADAKAYFRTFRGEASGHYKAPKKYFYVWRIERKKHMFPCGTYRRKGIGRGRFNGFVQFGHHSRHRLSGKFQERNSIPHLDQLRAESDCQFTHALDSLRRYCYQQFEITCTTRDGGFQVTSSVN